MNERENKIIVGEMLDQVFNRHEAEALERYVTPGVVDHNQIIFAQPEGPDGIVAGVQMFLHAFPDFHAEVRELLADGDAVVARLRLSGTNTGDYRGLAEPTRRRAEWDAVATFRLVDGKIAEIQGVADRMAMLTQLGVLPDIG